MRGNKRPKQRGVISENIEDETNQKGNFGEGLQYFSFSFSSSLTPPPLPLVPTQSTVCSPTVRAN